MQERFLGFIWLTVWNPSSTKEGAMVQIAEHLKEKEAACVYYPSREEIMSAVAPKLMPPKRPTPPPAPPTDYSLKRRQMCSNGLSEEI